MDEFKTNIPIIQTLGNPGMKPRHWEKISEIVGFPILVDDSLSLEKVIDFNLVDYIEKFEAISEAATKENNLEKALDKMMKEWADLKFDILVYKLVKLFKAFLFIFYQNKMLVSYSNLVTLLVTYSNVLQRYWIVHYIGC